MSNSLQMKRYRCQIGEIQRPFQTVIRSCIRDDDYTKYFDFAVIGSGVAGLRYALEVAKHGTVAVITKAEPHESNTNYAQGGVSAVLCPSDSVESHMQDTIVAGAYLCDEETVRVSFQMLYPNIHHPFLFLVIEVGIYQVMNICRWCVQKDQRELGN